MNIVHQGTTIRNVVQKVQLLDPSKAWPGYLPRAGNKEPQRMLYHVTEQLKNDADRKVLKAAHRFRNTDNARILAEQNAARADDVRNFCVIWCKLLILLSIIKELEIVRSTTRESTAHRGKYIGPKRFFPSSTINDKKQRKTRHVPMPTH